MSQEIDLPWFGRVLIKSVEETSSGDWVVSGPVASLKEDYDGDIMERSGILKGLEMFRKLGSHIDYAHQYALTHDPDYLIGKGISTKDVDGVPWITVQLFKAKKLAKKVWDHLQAGGEMGFSIEGIAKARSGRRITETEIHRITIDPSPKGFDDARKIRPGTIPDAMQLAKALVDGTYGQGSGEIDPMDPLDPIDKASVPHAHQRCKTCGGKIYCIHCHRNAAGKPLGETVEKAIEVLDKAMTTGEGVVAAGSQESAAPLRKQELRKKVAKAGCCSECGKDEKDCDCKDDKDCKEEELEKAFRASGARHPALLAKLAAARI